MLALEKAGGTLPRSISLGDSSIRGSDNSKASRCQQAKAAEAAMPSALLGCCRALRSAKSTKLGPERRRTGLATWRP
eukprot:CAMPEP_0206465308 /NCGR_PEP_ID=MMETSP0324_2-20121206/27750_1 /ASSEMBLY_ACC=CAM_ASM_000836 /TAXON_ID=2866 /ORGANISM="Crypthecodinium cohnii, Strain Seligo" /LENGTH=76 /DNA_ID=CAMNT_0053938137 /DNA_START=232 /DNA_END=459 /DNA_ORIENTATION=-